MEEKLVMENDEVVMVRRDGSKVQLDKLITFDDEANNKSYIIYTDNSKDEHGNIEVYASIYNPDDPQSKLEAIETEKEWKVIETILNTLQEEIKNKKDNEQ
jgi:uncharacterized protein YrzB (UPF0473 family)